MNQAPSIAATATSLAALVQHGAGKALRNVRFSIVLSTVLICGSFAGAAVYQMRADRTHAISQAAMFMQRRAGEMSTDLSATLNRYRALGAAFATATRSAETSAALSEAGGRALANVAVMDRSGRLHAEMMSSPKDFLPLDAATLAAARKGRVVIPSKDGRTMAIAFPVNGWLVAVQLKTAALMPRASMQDSLLALPDGRLVALGANWTEGPPQAALAMPGTSANLLLEEKDGTHLLSLHRLKGWPLNVAASIPVGDALGAWYGALPLYLFFILGPSLAGAALAVIFVREFERRAKLAEARRKLRATRPEEARLLVRLSEAERRATEAQRAKSEFIAHMSHELRTPLNAIIGFSEVIERGLFGEAGHPKYIEYARDIGMAGRALHAKIGDILEFADLDAGRHPIAMTTIDVTGIARAAVTEIAGRAFARHIKLIVALPERTPASGDAAAVRRILSLVLANAAQYTPPGGTIRIQARTEPTSVVISIRDTGTGFRDGEIVGEAFSRFDRPGAVTGTGLGVAVATALARRMGGALRIAGEIGDGTSAELRLPRARMEAKAS